MNVTLISFDEELYCVGIRTLSSCLRQADHKVQCVFLPPSATNPKASNKFQVAYPVRLLDEIKSLCSESEMIGMSLMTNQFIQAKCVTEYLKKHQIPAPIVWGGIQPTVEPEVCLEYADIVCLGEGEDALIELASCIENGLPYLGTRNMWLKTRNGIVRNPIRPLEQDLDRLPLPDYSCINHFIGNEVGIKELSADELIQFKGERFTAQKNGIRYPLLTSRGCPFSCNYCCNVVYENLYPKQRRLRWRSIDNVISELEMIQKEVGSIFFVHIVDDNFTSQPTANLEIFCERYRTEIAIPFSCQVSPLTVDEKKMEVLLNAGCAKVTMGVETGNERIAKLYNRSRFHKAVPHAIELVEKYRSRMSLPPTYQFIIDNPYETLDETLETLRLAISIPRPWHNPVYSLMLFPGTPLYERAQKDGLINDKYLEIYGRNWLDQSEPFFQLWIRLYRANISPFFLKILLQSWIARFMTTNFVSTLFKMKMFRWLWTNSR